MLKKSLAYLFLLLLLLLVMSLNSCDGSDEGNIQEQQKDNQNPTMSCLETINVTVGAFTNEL